ncbi:YrhC family protein [Bacillus sp. V59.32b]|uniref:YrhC family protein n=1 Tax=Bacillus sp. V59.32b TaxID=1758642 RepID=UPI0020B1734A|nr:YrhC family protein [Bacillus sp. V59.32b]
MKKLHEKMVDFKRFAVTLLCVGVFFYFGSIIPSEGKTMFDTYGMMGATTVFLVASIIFFTLSSKYKKILAENNESL